MPEISVESTLAEEHGLDLSLAQRCYVLDVVRRVVEADRTPLGPRSAQLLEVVREALRLGAHETTTGDAAGIAPSQRRMLADSLVVAACIEGEVTCARQVAVAQVARDLGVRSHWVDLLGALRRRRVLSVKRALMTHSPDARRLFARLWEEEGVLGLLRALVFALGLHRDAPLAARYRALASQPPGSLGRAFHDHFTSRRLAFPGEKGGMPERMLHHDLMHVLNGFDTDPAGECELAGFYAGFADGDAFTFIVIALATFHLGLRVSPAVVETSRGAFDPARVLAAFWRGRRIRVDVMGRWDYWALMPLPLDRARATLRA